jgi:hypothetical protein
MMFYQADRQLEFVPNPEDQFYEPVDFARIHSGCRFVEQEEPGPKGESPAYFHSPLKPVREVFGKLPRAMPKAQQIHQFLSRPFNPPLAL